VELLELGVFGRKSWSGVVFSDLELYGALPNTPLAIGFDKSMTYLKGNTTDCQEMFLLKAAHVLCAISLLFISLQIYHVNL
jgi:hypothetical protein